jgi:hemerythrin-like domain-containing protein
LATMGTVGSGVLLLSGPVIAIGTESKKEETEVGPAEDLMREHGGLNRILLIYEEGQRRIKNKLDFDPSSLKKSATIIRTFIEDYHEKLEEEFIFPRMRKLGKLTDLVNTLETQHKAGRKLTSTIEQLSVASVLKNEADQKKLLSSLEAFIRMYRPHESREDTILFPAFHESMSEKEYDELGEKFEDREHKLFGKEGFDGVVSQIETIEKSLGIYDLAQFTPETK